MAKLAIQVVVYLTVVVFGLGLFFLGDEPQPQWLRLTGLAVAVSTLVLAAFERYIWKWDIAQKFERIPTDVSGTWLGTLTSHWVDPDTGDRVPPKQAILVVRQTASTVRVSLHTDESHSKSSLGRVTIDDEPELVYMYLNRPDMSVEHRSRIHHGSTSLRISTDGDTCKLKGSYWTDRDSKGELTFSKRKKNTFVNDYDAGLRLFD